MSGLDGYAICVAREIGDFFTLPNVTSGFRRVIEQDLVEPRTFDLIRGGIFAAENVAKEKTIGASSAGGNDLAAILHDHIGAIDLLLYARPFEGAEASRRTLRLGLLYSS